MTMTFTATFGLSPGYSDHSSPLGSRAIAEAVHSAIERVQATSGVIVGCVVQPAQVFYPFAFGCPVQGESVIVVSGAHNPKFCGADSWREAATALVELIKETLRQERVTLTFSPAEIVYLEPEHVSTPVTSEEEGTRK